MQLFHKAINNSTCKTDSGTSLTCLHRDGDPVSLMSNYILCGNSVPVWLAPWRICSSSRHGDFGSFDEK